MVEKPLVVFWLPSALADLDRFAEFLVDSQPQLASEIAAAVLSGAEILAEQPMIGRPLRGQRFRQLVLIVRKASYVLRYRVEKRRIVILRVFHGREQRKQ